MLIEFSSSGTRVFYFVCFLFHVLILYLMLDGTLSPLFNDATHRLGQGTDFAAYYNAGAAFLQGDSIYGQGPGFGFRYHPLFALTIGAALALLPFQLAFAAWVLVQQLALLALAWLFHVSITHKLHRYAALALTIVFSPLYLEIFMGNATFVAMVVLLWALHCYLQGKALAHHLLLLLSLLIKPLGLLLLPAYLFRNDLKTPLLAGSVFVLAALPYFYLDNTAFSVFMQVNAGELPMPGWLVHAGNQGLHALLLDGFVRQAGIATHEFSACSQLPLLARLVLHGLLPLFVFIAAIISWRHRDKLCLVFSSWLIIYPLAYKDVWEHSYVWFLAILYLLYLSRLAALRWLGVIALWSALPTPFILYDVPLPAGPIDPEHYWGLPVAVLHHLARPLPVLVLYVYVIYLAFRPHRHSWPRFDRGAKPHD